MLPRASIGPGGPRRARRVADEACDTRLAARVIGWLYLSGATIGLVSLILPHPVHADVLGLYTNVALAFGGGGIALATANRFRPWMIHASLVMGAVLVTRAVLLSGERVSFYAAWYIWIGLYAFYFCRRRAAAAHVTFCALLYALTLAQATPSSPVARWLTTLTTLIVAGGLIDTLVRRVRHEAAAAAASAASMAKVTELAHALAALSESGPARVALCEGAMRVAGADRVALWEPCGDRPGLRVTAAAGLEAAVTEAAFADPPTSVIRAFRDGELTSSLSPSGTGELASLWCPIIRDQQSAAVLEISRRDGSADEDRARVAMAGLLAAEAGVTLVRVALLEELEHVARTDELTGLPNRRAWHEQLGRELARAARTGESLAVAMLDLDHFKRYNDTHGHQTGDRLLKEVASAWSLVLRPTDVLARFGGEEFSLGLPARAADDAIAVVERLRGAVPEAQSCSAGVAIWNRQESAAELLDRADHALYRAKRLGRNRSALAPEEDWAASAG